MEEREVVEAGKHIEYDIGPFHSMLNATHDLYIDGQILHVYCHGVGCVHNQLPGHVSHI